MRYKNLYNTLFSSISNHFNSFYYIYFKTSQFANVYIIIHSRKIFAVMLITYLSSQYDSYRHSKPQLAWWTSLAKSLASTLALTYRLFFKVISTALHFFESIRASSAICNCVCVYYLISNILLLYYFVVKITYYNLFKLFGYTMSNFYYFWLMLEVALVLLYTFCKIFLFILKSDKKISINLYQVN